MSWVHALSAQEDLLPLDALIWESECEPSQDVMAPSTPSLKPYLDIYQELLGQKPIYTYSSRFEYGAKIIDDTIDRLTKSQDSGDCSQGGSNATYDIAINPLQPELAIIEHAPVTGDAMRDTLAHLEWQSYMLDTFGLWPDLDVDSMYIYDGLRMPWNQDAYEQFLWTHEDLGTRPIQTEVGRKGKEGEVNDDVVQTEVANGLGSGTGKGKSKENGSMAHEESNKGTWSRELTVVNVGEKRKRGVEAADERKRQALGARNEDELGCSV